MAVAGSSRDACDHASRFLQVIILKKGRTYDEVIVNFAILTNF